MVEGFRNEIDWTTNLTFANSIKIYDEDLQKDGFQDYVDLVEDCDIDCQHRGSGITIVANLNGLALGLICLNAIITFFGVWMSMFRVCSTYFNFLTCMFQTIVLIFSATCLFNQYSIARCSRSMTLTSEGRLYTMADDYFINVMCWIIQIPCVFFFLCCGCCGSYRSEGNGIVLMNSFTSK